MADPIITNVDQGSVILEGGDFRDDTYVAGGAATIPAGTILARETVANKITPFVVSGANGTGTPKAVLTYDLVLSGAGDFPVRMAVAGKFRKERLIIAADGDDSNITETVCDQLRVYGLIPINVTELADLDNQ